MLLWASATGEAFLTAEENTAAVQKLLALQQTDGGWKLPSLGDWKRGNGDAQSTESDGYGTGFVIYVLRQAGTPADDAQLQRGVAWLKKNQRESGRWFTHSLKKAGHHYISHAGSAFAVMAIQACDAQRTAAVTKP